MPKMTPFTLRNGQYTGRHETEGIWFDALKLLRKDKGAHPEISSWRHKLPLAHILAMGEP